MTKRLGLTPAMRRALDDIGSARFGTFKRLCEMGLARVGNRVGPYDETVYFRIITPRGQAALAAEPMTDAQYTALALIAEHGDAVVTHSVSLALVRRGWIYAYSIITPAGRTQLHNVRAAMSGEWKP